jgi:hypothetical protein
MPRSPYEGKAARSYWRTGVAEQSPETVPELYHKKFDIARDARIATAGSCFAQHIARYLRRERYCVVDEEPAPPGLAPELAKKFGFSLFSARYANIYVVRQLLQLLRETRGEFEPADWIWQRDGRYYDALRPSVEPYGLDSPDEVRAHRAEHLEAVRRLFSRVDLFIFTFGLTETWIHRESGTVYPTAPGTVAGDFDPAVHQFKNFTFTEIYEDFLTIRELLRAMNPELKFLVTVSPVPLTATASDDHVLTATIYSKSVLRAVAGQLYNEFDDIDYFPSYELIASHFSKGRFYAPNLRSVADEGVEVVMRHFLKVHAGAAALAAQNADESAPRKKRRPVSDEDDVVCEEVLLDAFAG